MQIILISDLHLDDPARSAEAAAHAARVGAYLDRIGDCHPQAELCVIAGDLTNHGEPGAYRWLRQRVENLPFPTVPMLGNHDDRGAVREVFAGCADENGFIQSARRAGDFRLVFLDTHDPGSDAGLLCADRLAWLDRQLGDAGADGVCLVLHHPPCDIGDPVLDPIKLSNAGELAAVLRRHGNVRQIIFGHVHRSMFLVWNGHACASLDSLGDAARDTSPGRPATIALLQQIGDGLALSLKTLTV